MGRQAASRWNSWPVILPFVDGFWQGWCFEGRSSLCRTNPVHRLVTFVPLGWVVVAGVKRGDKKPSGCSQAKLVPQPLTDSSLESPGWCSLFAPRPAIFNPNIYHLIICINCMQEHQRWPGACNGWRWQQVWAGAVCQRRGSDCQEGFLSGERATRYLVGRRCLLSRGPCPDATCRHPSAAMGRDCMAQTFQHFWVLVSTIRLPWWSLWAFQHNACGYFRALTPVHPASVVTDGREHGG